MSRIHEVDLPKSSKRRAAEFGAVAIPTILFVAALIFIKGDRGAGTDFTTDRIQKPTTDSRTIPDRPIPINSVVPIEK